MSSWMAVKSRTSPPWSCNPSWKNAARSTKTEMKSTKCCKAHDLCWRTSQRSCGVPIGCSFLFLATASLSNFWSLTLARCRRSESLDFSCNAVICPPRFLEICLRVFWNVPGMLSARLWWTLSDLEGGIETTAWKPLGFSFCLRKNLKTDRFCWWYVLRTSMYVGRSYRKPVGDWRGCMGLDSNPSAAAIG